MNVLQAAVGILDSYPHYTRRRFKGQSLVEMAISTPILFLMIIGLAEIGFLANNYLILLDAVRAGARYGVTLSPLTWDDANSTRNYYRTACQGQSQAIPQYNMFLGETPALSSPHGPPASDGYTQNPADIPLDGATKGIFDGVACQTVGSMQPLNFDVTYNNGNPDPTVNHDDVAVSVVAYIVDPQGVAHVTGRWPQSNRMCTGDARDPFAYNGQTPPVPNPPDGLVRGFVVTGNMSPPDHPACYGSYFNVGAGDANDVEKVINTLTTTSGIASDVAKSGVNGAMVIVEMNWTHHQLFNMPPYSFVGNPTLHVWAAFPASAAMPTPTPAPTPTP